MSTPKSYIRAMKVVVESDLNEGGATPRAPTRYHLSARPVRTERTVIPTPYSLSAHPHSPLLFPSASLPPSHPFSRVRCKGAVSRKSSVSSLRILLLGLRVLG